MTVTAVDILNAAIEGWETKGWIQNRSVDETGATCSSGGIERAALSQAQYGAPIAYALSRAFDQACLAFRDAIEDRNGNSIVTWNDMPGRTVEDVILTAKRAIEKLEILTAKRAIEKLEAEAK